MKIILNSSSHDHYQSVSKLIIVKENEMKDFFIDTGKFFIFKKKKLKNQQ